MNSQLTWEKANWDQSGTKSSDRESWYRSVPEQMNEQKFLSIYYIYITCYTLRLCKIIQIMCIIWGSSLLKVSKKDIAPKKRANGNIWQLNQHLDGNHILNTSEETSNLPAKVVRWGTMHMQWTILGCHMVTGQAWGLSHTAWWILFRLWIALGMSKVWSGL